MSLSYALGDDSDLRRRLMVKIGAPLVASINHTAETPEAIALKRITSDIYRAAQDSNRSNASRATGDAGAL